MGHRSCPSLFAPRLLGEMLGCTWAHCASCNDLLLLLRAVGSNKETWWRRWMRVDPATPLASPLISCQTKRLVSGLTHTRSGGCVFCPSCQFLYFTFFDLFFLSLGFLCECEKVLLQALLAYLRHYYYRQRSTSRESESRASLLHSAIESGHADFVCPFWLMWCSSPTRGRHDRASDFSS